MYRLLFTYLAMAFFFGSGGHLGRAVGQNLELEPIRMLESKPAKANGATFTLVAEGRLKMSKRDEPVEIQLRIGNVSNQDLIFHTFDTFGLFLRTSDDKSLQIVGTRFATVLTRPVLIPKGESFTLCRKAELRWNPKTQASELAYWDGTGHESRFGPLRPGRYKMGFWYGTNADGPEPIRDVQQKKIDGVAPWRGDAMTEMVIEVVAP